MNRVILFVIWIALTDTISVMVKSSDIVKSNAVLNSQCRQVGSKKEPNNTREEQNSKCLDDKASVLDDNALLIEKLLQGYNKDNPPMKGQATEVNISIYIAGFHSISVQDMEYSLTFYLRQHWHDTRLAFASEDGKTASIRLPDGRQENFWQPDTFVTNEKRSSSLLQANRLIKLDNTGNVLYSQKISATLSCPMKLERYPMDTQFCPIFFESFGYTMDIMYLHWVTSPVLVDPNVKLPHFSLVDTIIENCSKNLTSGAYPCLEVQFALKRDFGYYFLRMYIPSGLIVILSWISFFNVDKVAERLSVGLVIILTMTMWDTGSQGSLPRVSYITALDVWTSWCLIFVFASLVEVGIVNAMSQKTKHAEEPNMQNSSTMSVSPSTERQLNDMDIEMQMCEEEKKEKRGFQKPKNCSKQSKGQKVDEISRITFPVAFLLFNVAYWSIYLT